MKRACPYCGKTHDRKERCESAPKYNHTRGSREDIFRWSYDWKCKREYVLRRDKYLCVACRNRLPGTAAPLNNIDLSVHHIQPLRTNWELRMEDSNLITLCRMHHEMAECGELSAEQLNELVKNMPPGGSGVEI